MICTEVLELRYRFSRDIRSNGNVKGICIDLVHIASREGADCALPPPAIVILGPVRDHSTRCSLHQVFVQVQHTYSEVGDVFTLSRIQSQGQRVGRQNNDSLS